MPKTDWPEAPRRGVDDGDGDGTGGADGCGSCAPAFVAARAERKMAKAAEGRGLMGGNLHHEAHEAHEEKGGIEPRRRGDAEGRRGFPQINTD